MISAPRLASSIVPIGGRMRLFSRSFSRPPAPPGRHPFPQPAQTRRNTGGDGVSGAAGDSPIAGPRPAQPGKDSKCCQGSRSSSAGRLEAGRGHFRRTWAFVHLVQRLHRHGRILAPEFSEHARRHSAPGSRRHSPRASPRRCAELVMHIDAHRRVRSPRATAGDRTGVPRIGFDVRRSPLRQPAPPSGFQRLRLHIDGVRHPLRPHRSRASSRVCEAVAAAHVADAHARPYRQGIDEQPAVFLPAVGSRAIRPRRAGVVASSGQSRGPCDAFRRPGEVGTGR